MNHDHGLREALAAFQGGSPDRARALAEALVEAAPGNAPAHHLIGLIDCRSGRIADGITHLRQASDLDPANAPFRIMLVRALVDSGKPEEALEAAVPPSGQGGAEIALWQARAEAADAAGDRSTSAEAWQQVCAARPDDWRAWSNHGQALAALDKWRDAAAALRQALAINPGEAPVRRNLAAALARAGFHEESLAQYQRLAADRPDDPGLRLILSRLLADLGRTEQSIAEFEQAAAIASGPSGGGGEGRLIDVALASAREGGSSDLECVREMSLLLERTNRIDALRQLLDEAETAGIARDQLGYAAATIAMRDGEAAEARALLERESPDSDPVRWHWLMARIADLADDPATAFAEAEAMNRSVDDHDRWRRRGSEYRDYVRGLAALATPEWGAKLFTAPPGKRPSPAFLLGFPRSGTTLLDTFLMGHPDVVVIEEQPMLGAAEQVLGKLAAVATSSPAQLEAARNAYFAELDRHVAAGFAGLVIDKLPLNMIGLPLIYSLFPDARIIFAQRHPADVVLSGFMQSFVLNDGMASFLDLADAADFYDSGMAAFTRGRAAVPLAVHNLVYEELVADPERALRPLIDFLGLEWRGEALDHRATASARGVINTPSYNQVTEPLSKRPSGRWRRYKAQLAPVLPILQPWAEHLGYGEDDGENSQ